MKAMKDAIKNRKKALVIKIEIEPEEVKGKGLEDPIEFAGEDKLDDYSPENDGPMPAAEADQEVAAEVPVKPDPDKDVQIAGAAGDDEVQLDDKDLNEGKRIVESNRKPQSITERMLAEQYKKKQG